MTSISYNTQNIHFIQVVCHSLTQVVSLMSTHPYPNDDFYFYSCLMQKKKFFLFLKTKKNSHLVCFHNGDGGGGHIWNIVS